jgi:hypothetical protein
LGLCDKSLRTDGSPIAHSFEDAPPRLKTGAPSAHQLGRQVGMVDTVPSAHDVGKIKREVVW